VDGCPGYAIEQALRYAAGLSNDSGVIPPQPAQVVNLSLGRQGGPALTQEQLLYDQLRALDIFVVASAGNSSTSAVAYPAAYGNVTAVSALDFAGQRAFYSNFGAWIDVAAPGGDLGRDLNADGFPDGVLSTSADDRDGPPQPSYRFLQGTSMAAPHVAGVAALMRAAVPELRAQDIENLLRNQVITDDLGSPGKDDIYGWGLINAFKAVTETLNAGGEPVPLAPFMAASAETVSFGLTLQDGAVVFSNIGEGELVFGVPTEDSGGWLSLVAEEVEGELYLSLRADRAGLPEGRYLATVTMPSSANTLEVAVVMQVATLPGANVGLQYVLLLDPDSMQALYYATAQPAGDGRQSFRIENVAPGSYLLVGGSDADNDGAVCDAGESCGSYREGADIAPVEVADEDLDGLQFESGYTLPATGPESSPAPGGGIFIGRD
jgi:serine protease